MFLDYVVYRTNIIILAKLQVISTETFISKNKLILLEKNQNHYTRFNTSLMLMKKYIRYSL